MATAEQLLSLLESNQRTTKPGIPFAHSPLGSGEKLHLLWLYSGLFQGAAAARAPTQVPAPAIPIQRYLVRTAMFDQAGECTIENFRISVKRGIGGNVDDPVIHFRAKRDNAKFTRVITRSLGLAGDKFSTVNIGPLGTAHVWQFECWCDDDCDVELQSMEAIIKRIGH